MAVLFNADNLGSFLRPPALLEARQQGLTGQALRRIEDRAITEVVRMQEAVGLPIVTDGEYRRKLFFSTVVATADGFDPEGFERSHRDEQGRVLKFGVPTPVARLRRQASLVDLEYRFTRSLTEAPIKVTMPSPSLLRPVHPVRLRLHLRRQRDHSGRPAGQAGAHRANGHEGLGATLIERRLL